VRAIAAAGAAVLLLAGCGGDDGDGDGPASEPGPLASRQSRNAYQAYARTGQRFSYGVPVVHNEADRPLTLERVVVGRASPGLRVVAQHAGGPRRRANLIGGGPVSYAGQDLHPLAGYELAPARTAEGRRGAEIVLDLRADRPGRYVLRDLAVEYRVGDRRHRARLPNAFAVCVARTLREAFRRRCPLP
jgi:hypothetical protein